jgi:hypothetical protein
MIGIAAVACGKHGSSVGLREPIFGRSHMASARIRTVARADAPVRN